MAARRYFQSEFTGMDDAPTGIRVTPATMFENMCIGSAPYSSDTPVAVSRWHSSAAKKYQNTNPDTMVASAVLVGNRGGVPVPCNPHNATGMSPAIQCTFDMVVLDAAQSDVTSSARQYIQVDAATGEVTVQTDLTRISGLQPSMGKEAVPGPFTLTLKAEGSFGGAPFACSSEALPVSWTWVNCYPERVMAVFGHNEPGTAILNGRSAYRYYITPNAYALRRASKDDGPLDVADCGLTFELGGGEESDDEEEEADADADAEADAGATGVGSSGASTGGAALATCFDSGAAWSNPVCVDSKTGLVSIDVTPPAPTENARAWYARHATVQPDAWDGGRGEISPQYERGVLRVYAKRGSPNFSARHSPGKAKVLIAELSIEICWLELDAYVNYAVQRSARAMGISLQLSGDEDPVRSIEYPAAVTVGGGAAMAAAPIFDDEDDDDDHPHPHRHRHHRHQDSHAGSGTVAAGAASSSSSLSKWGCPKPQPPITTSATSLTNAIGAAMKQAGATTCRTSNTSAEAGGGITGAVHHSTSSGCSTWVANASSYNNFSQSMMCNINQVSSSQSSFIDQQIKLNITAPAGMRVGGDFVVRATQTAFAHDFSKLDSKAQQHMVASSFAAIHAVSKNTLEDSSSYMAVPNGSKVMKTVAQNLANIASVENLNKVHNNVLLQIQQGDSMDITLPEDVGGNVDIDLGMGTMLVVRQMTKNVMDHVLNSTSDDQVTEKDYNNLITQNTGPGEVFKDMGGGAGAALQGAGKGGGELLEGAGKGGGAALEGAGKGGGALLEGAGKGIGDMFSGGFTIFLIVAGVIGAIVLYVMVSKRQSQMAGHATPPLHLQPQALYTTPPLQAQYTPPPPPPPQAPPPPPSPYPPTAPPWQ